MTEALTHDPPVHRNSPSCLIAQRSDEPDDPVEVLGADRSGWILCHHGVTFVSECAADLGVCVSGHPLEDPLETNERSDPGRSLRQVVEECLIAVEEALSAPDWVIVSPQGLDPPRELGVDLPLNRRACLTSMAARLHAHRRSSRSRQGLRHVAWAQASIRCELSPNAAMNASLTSTKGVFLPPLVVWTKESNTNVAGFPFGASRPSGRSSPM